MSPQNSRADADVAVRRLLARLTTHNIQLIELYIKSSARRLMNRRITSHTEPRFHVPYSNPDSARPGLILYPGASMLLFGSSIPVARHPA
jgi:hypothetical protein